MQMKANTGLILSEGETCPEYFHMVVTRKYVFHIIFNCAKATTMAIF